jgi:hypothetical protein
LRGPVDAGDELVVVSQAVDFLELGAFLGVDVDVLGVGTDGNPGSVGIEREGKNRTCKQLMHLWSRHFQRTGQDGSQPLMDHSPSMIQHEAEDTRTAMCPKILSLRRISCLGRIRANNYSLAP